MVTNSRYDFMNSGDTQDEVLGSFYPDPLSLNYLNLKLVTLPRKDVMNNDSQITMFWKEAYDMYGKSCWDDVVLTLNDIPHKNFLKSGDVIYFPSEEDITRSFSKERDNIDG